MEYDSDLDDKKEPPVRIGYLNAALEEGPLRHKSPAQGIRMNHTISLIPSYDIFAMVEVAPQSRRDYIASQLPGYKSVSFRAREHPSQGYIPNFVKRDDGIQVLTTYDILEDEELMFVNCASWDLLAIKGCKYVKLQAPDGAIFHLFVTHFQAQRAHDVREKQFEELYAFVENKCGDVPDHEKVVIVGDFNTTRALPEMVGEGYTDVGAKEKEPTRGSLRIDYIFTKNIKTEKCSFRVENHQIGSVDVVKPLTRFTDVFRFVWDNLTDNKTEVCTDLSDHYMLSLIIPRDA